MGHQHHFLSRLDRVALPHVELALSLYRDEPLVRYVLGSARLPEGAERVAISLEHPEEGPFLVVTREGRFVTCLAAGMKTHDLPVIPRGHLDAHMAKIKDLTDRAREAQDLARVHGSMQRLIERVYSAGPWLSREEHRALSAFQPLYGVELIRAYLGAISSLEQPRDRLLKVLRPSPALKPMLRAYWDTVWAVSHLAVLALADARELLPALLEKMPPDMAAQLAVTPVSWGAVRQAVLAPALRALWGIARLGKGQLKICKDAFEVARSPLQLITAGASLIALGALHARLRAEVRKALEAPRDLGKALFTPEQLQMLRVAADMAFEAPEQTAAKHRRTGAELAVRLTAHAPRGSLYRFTRWEEVPEDLAMPLAALSMEGILDVKGMASLASFLPWAARAEAEALYLPQDFLRSIKAPWDPKETIALLAPLRALYGPELRQPWEKEPTRNGPCPCGSGKKHKRCCGMEA